MLTKQQLVKEHEDSAYAHAALLDETINSEPVCVNSVGPFPKPPEVKATATRLTICQWIYFNQVALTTVK